MFHTFLAVVATAPYDKKVFSDEFIDELKKELLEKVKPQDARPLVPIKPGKLVFLSPLNTVALIFLKQIIDFII